MSTTVTVVRPTAIPISKLLPVGFGGSGVPGAHSRSTLPSGRLHAASLTVTADPGSTCDVRADLAFDPEGDGINVKRITVLFLLVKGRAERAESQTVSYNFTQPIEIRYTFVPSDDGQAYTDVGSSAAFSVGNCSWSGTAIYEKL